MTVQPEISQRDLRMRSKEIMDSVERGQAFVLTRDGHRIGQLVPFRHSRTFVPRADFLAAADTIAIDPEGFRDDLESHRQRGQRPVCPLSTLERAAPSCE